MAHTKAGQICTDLLCDRRHLNSFFVRKRRALFHDRRPGAGGQRIEEFATLADERIPAPPDRLHCPGPAS
ncbi:hypothetical protein GCM10009673_02260 [Nesterenkonia sandarakina]